MNEKYGSVAYYHVIIKYNFGLLIEALDALCEYNPTMREVSVLMKEVDREVEDEGRRLLKSIEKEC